MDSPAIRIDGVGKRYRLGRIGRGSEDYITLRESLTDLATVPWRRLRGIPAEGPPKEFWAIRDIHFEIQAGEVVGIIGRNGAGKSTLLKVLSRITKPTVGRAELRGRVGSLLEVGTGFHPELTGRENIYLNGAILGMKRSEIVSKFDEIVAFAEVEKFIETPVKRYSSGMYLRLAFAVAAHLEPEILLVDEVLAVGDASFQRRCLAKMQEVGRAGRTVIFVSHSMPAITRLCDRTILLDGGRVLQDGPSHRVVGAYLSSGLGTTSAREWPEIDRAPGNDVVRLRAVRVRLDDGRVSDAVDIRKPVGIEMEFDVLKPGHVLVPNFHFYNEEGIYAFIVHEQGPEWRRKPRPVGRFTSTAWIPGNFLAEGTLIIRAAVSTLDPVTVHFDERDVVAFQVIDSLEGDSARGDLAAHYPGVVRPVVPWTNRYEPTAGDDPASAIGPSPDPSRFETVRP